MAAEVCRANDPQAAKRNGQTLLDTEEGPSEGECDEGFEVGAREQTRRSEEGPGLR